MNTDTYPRAYTPFLIFPNAPYDVTISIIDRSEGSHVTVHTHKAGLELLKQCVDNALKELNKKCSSLSEKGSEQK